MGGLDDLLAGSADRWAKAERRAEGVADLCLGRAVRNYFTLYLPIGAVVLFPTGASLGMLSFPDEASITNIFGFGCLLTGVGLMIGGLVSNAKVLETAANMGTSDVTLSLRDDERKAVRRQILGRAATTPDHMNVKHAAAVQARKGLATQLVYSVAMFYIFFQQVAMFESPLRWLSAGGAILYIVAIFFVGRDFRKSGQFLAADPTLGRKVRGQRAPGRSESAHPSCSLRPVRNRCLWRAPQRLPESSGAFLAWPRSR